MQGNAVGHMPSNVDITQALRELLRADIPSRPFLCSGSPVGCEVVLLGINPATTTPFWDYWSEDGCNRAAWLQDYLRREGRFKPTRKRIEIVVETLAPEVRVLELNLFPYSSPREHKLADELRDRRVFDYVMSLADPKLVFVFGNTPTRELAELLGSALPLRQYTPVTLGGKAFEVYVDKHLSYQWRDAAVKQLAIEFKVRVIAARSRATSQFVCS